MQVYEKNPYRLIKTTKSTVQNLLLCVANEEVGLMLKYTGCTKVVTKLQYDYERDGDGMLTNTKNGNRSLLVDKDELTKMSLLR